MAFMFCNTLNLQSNDYTNLLCIISLKGLIILYSNTFIDGLKYPFEMNQNKLLQKIT